MPSNISDFKLIAILPLKDCDTRFRKKLEIGTTYQFYQGYNISLNEHYSAVTNVTVDPEKQAPKGLYSLNNGITVNISAVVGKNGTGKSTLFELLYRAVYFMSTKNEFYGGQILNTSVEELEKDLGKHRKNLRLMIDKAGLDIASYPKAAGVEIGKPDLRGLWILIVDLLRKDRYYFDSKRASGLRGIPKILAGELNSKIADCEHLLAMEIELEKLQNRKFNVSVLYQAEGTVWELECSKGKARHYKFNNQSGEKEEVADALFELEQFFYTISLNYSHHGLNASTVGKWINKLFHKNDGYRTPLVLNPMRHDGNFDINHEIRLSNERLMATLIYDYIHKVDGDLLGKYKISKFIYKRKTTSSNAVFTKELFDKLSHSALIRKIYGIDERQSDLPNAEHAFNYLSKKIAKVAENYDFLIYGGSSEEEALERFLKKDESHITKKIRQTINYLQQVTRRAGTWSYEHESDPDEVVLDAQQLEDFLSGYPGFKSMDPSTLVEYALPGFFKIDFEFSYDDNDKIKLSDMSSGEQQMIFNSNAILYHLYNLQSIFSKDYEILDTETEQVATRAAYPYVNIVLDEMELYYHPEMQRRFVSELMRVFARFKDNKGIRAINVCILTHSPFVLSDIPVQNILQLRDDTGVGLPQAHQSFASNIHDLLKREFLLERGFMGEFARMKIKLVIDSLVIYEEVTELGFDPELPIPDEVRAVVLARRNGLGEFKWNSLLDKTRCSEYIAIVGEPVLYQSLVELYLKVFPKHKDSFIDRQLKFLNTLKGGN
ncbi:MAG: hypothetical protein EOP48_00425 [Sphingobacteriales bacterium]|nr:MAG: hypothetical protein EOP48_00425 [Sphingobacteriales bacterium]